ncbi:MAG: AAA family ATPase [Dehalococcoidales bacterium]|nr:AAA family ATPase [Dehalococcoidales bacterium]
MILRAIEVENWRCIDQAKLVNLPDGIIILHGPNRSGKSSLFKAVRSCLYDFDHDSGNREIQNAIPRGTKKTPRIVVEFETGGAHYRILKVFSKGKQGTALLERWANGRWVTEISDPKEASRRVRELLGSYSSEQGLNHLLWLEQGVTTPPKERELDETLEKRLESILGTLVTSEDIDFKKALDKRCSIWFTEKMAEKSTSPLAALRRDNEQQEASLLEAGKKLAQVEETTLRLEEIETEIPTYEKQVAESEEEVVNLKAEQKQSQERRQAHEKAIGKLEISKVAFNTCEKECIDFKKLQSQLVEAENQLIAYNASVESAKEKCESAKTSQLEAESKANEARDLEDTHSQQNAELQDRRKLVNATNRIAWLDKTIEKTSAVEHEITELKDRIVKTPAPSKDELDKLRALSTEILRLKTQLEADGLDIVLTSTNDQTVPISCDSGDTEEVSLSGGVPKSISIQQRAVLEIPQFGKIEAGRRVRDFNLDEAARRCSSLETQFRDTTTAWGEDPNAEEVLNRLSQRSLTRNHLEERLEESRVKLSDLSPEGVTDLVSERNKKKSEIGIVLKRRPYLKEWAPDEAEFSKFEEAYQQKVKELATTRKKAETFAAEARQTSQKQIEKYMSAKEAVTRAQATVENLRDQLKNMGDSVSIKEALEKAKERKIEAEKEVSDTTLTEAEITVDERLQAATSALENRQKRLVTAQRTFEGYRGELKATEGLHAEIAEAERALEEVTARLEEATLEAEAHKHLRQLFDHARDSQVVSKTDPIRERVLGWIRGLGIDDYRDVAFEQSYFPTGLVSVETGDNEVAIPFSEESFGTEEQLSLLVRLALGGILAKDEAEVAILDDILAHSDPIKHRGMLDILKSAAKGKPAYQEGQRQFGQLQLFILTCHPERFDYLTDAKQIDFVHDCRY